MSGKFGLFCFAKTRKSASPSPRARRSVRVAVEQLECRALLSGVASIDDQSGSATANPIVKPDLSAPAIVGPRSSDAHTGTAAFVQGEAAVVDKGPANASETGVNQVHEPPLTTVGSTR